METKCRGYEKMDCAGCAAARPEIWVGWQGADVQLCYLHGLWLQESFVCPKSIICNTDTIKGFFFSWEYGTFFRKLVHTAYKKIYYNILNIWWMSILESENIDRKLQET